MHRYIISIGSNCAMRYENMRKALQSVCSIYDDVVCSDIIESKAYDMPDDATPFLNQIIIVRTDSTIEETNIQLKRIEEKIGRRRDIVMPREIEIDLDIVYVDDNLLRPKDTKRDYFIKGLQNINKKRK